MATKTFYPLLTTLEREYYHNVVEVKLNEFDELIKTIILNQDKMKLNSLTLFGPQGTGKTYNTLKVLNDLLDQGRITGLKYASGEITRVGLFNLLEEQKDYGNITVLDDCDVILNPDCLPTLKAASDTKSNQKPRIVTYNSNRGDRNFEFNGFIVHLTNENYYKYADVHMAAVLDRMHIFKLDITRYDIFLRNAFLAENELNEFEDENMKLEFAAFFQEEIREFVKKGIFDNCKLSFSLRFVNKLTDLYPAFNSRWKSASMEYSMLTEELKRYNEFEKNNPQLINFIRPTKEEDARTSVERAKELGWQQIDGLWYKPKTDDGSGFEMYDQLYKLDVEVEN